LLFKAISYFQLSRSDESSEERTMYRRSPSVSGSLIYSTIIKTYDSSAIAMRCVSMPAYLLFSLPLFSCLLKRSNAMQNAAQAYSKIWMWSVCRTNAQW